MKFLNQAYIYYFKQNGYNYSALRKLKFDLSDILISCTFNNVLCNPSDFTPIHHLRNGNCWLFNGPKNGNVKQTYWAGKN